MGHWILMLKPLWRPSLVAHCCRPPPSTTASYGTVVQVRPVPVGTIATKLNFPPVVRTGTFIVATRPATGTPIACGRRMLRRPYIEPCHTTQLIRLWLHWHKRDPSAVFGPSSRRPRSVPIVNAQP